MKEESETTKANLEMAARQFDLEWKPDLYVEMIWGDHHDEARITNLGRSTALLLGFAFRCGTSSETFKRFPMKKEIVSGGGFADVPITRGLWQYFREMGLMDGSNQIIGSVAGSYQISFSFHCGGGQRESPWLEFPVDSKGRIPRGT